MATAEELLLGATNTTTFANDSGEVDNTLYIDFDSRDIKIPKTILQLGVESDDDVNKLTFSVPRLYLGTDLSTFNIYINYMNAKKEGDLFKVLPEKVTTDENDNLIFDWIVGRQAVAYKGTAIFNVCMKKVSDTETDEEGNPVVVQEFNTTIAKLPVLEGLETGEAVVQEYADILVQWEEMLFGIEDSAKKNIILKGSEVVEAVNAAGEEQRKQIVLKGSEVLSEVSGEVAKVTTEGEAQRTAIIQKGSEVTTAVNTAGEEQRTAIIQKGKEVTDTIAEKKTEFDTDATTQINAVNTAGETQRTAIIQKGSEVLNTLEETLPTQINTYITEHPDEFKGDKGDKGDTGEPGKDGTSVTILGSYSTEAELEAAHPTGTKGDGYIVNGDLYIWDVTNNTWKNVGRIQGPKGDTGDTGAKGDTGDKGDTGATGPKGDPGTDGTDGVSPSVSTSKTGKITTVTITDATGEHVFTINDGADGTGTGDMVKATYDADNDGVVDDAAALGGVAADQYALKTDIPGAVTMTATNDGNGNITILLGGATNG